MAIDAADTRYVAVGSADVAYKVVGSDGPLDLLYFYGLGSQIDMFFANPRSRPWISGLASFSRLICFDRRGTGASDGVALGTLLTWEEWIEDIEAVLDAVGSQRAAIFAALDAGPIAMLFAATHPERVSALVLANTSARWLEAADYEIGSSNAALDAFIEVVTSIWGTEQMSRLINPGLADEAEYRRETAMRLRAAATPRTASAQYRYLLENVDVRPALSLIRAPTLVLHNPDNPIVPVAHGRYLAEHISNATFVELQGGGIGFDDGATASVVQTVSEFLTGERAAVEIDRVLTTVLFTDIVSSTDRAVALGDQQWRRLLDRHDRVVRDQLRRFRGREINTTGDGFCASFDGPARAIRCAESIVEAAGDLGLQVRAGVHAGECEIRGSDLAGVAVHVAARIGALAEPNEVLVSSVVRDLVAGSGITFSDRGEHQLKGLTSRWSLFAATSPALT